MTEQEKVLVKKIAQYNEYFKGFETLENGELSEELVLLRKHIFFVHNSVETLLQGCIYKHLANSTNDARVIPTIIKAAPLLDKITHAQVLQIALEVGIIDKREKDVLNKVNTHRNTFSHTSGYKKGVASYKKLDYYLETLQLLARALTIVVEVTERHNKHLSEYETNLRSLTTSPFKKS